MDGVGLPSQIIRRVIDGHSLVRIQAIVLDTNFGELLVVVDGQASGFHKK